MEHLFDAKILIKGLYVLQNNGSPTRRLKVVVNLAETIKLIETSLYHLILIP